MSEATLWKKKQMIKPTFFLSLLITMSKKNKKSNSMSSQIMYTLDKDKRENKMKKYIINN